MAYRTTRHALACLCFFLFLAATPAHAFLFSYSSSGALTGDHKKYIVSLLGAFQADHPEVKVELREAPSYIKPIVETLMSENGDSAPDLAVVGLVEWPLLLKKNLVAPLTAVLSKAELEQIWKALRPELTVQHYGKHVAARQYAFPFNRSYPILYVNEDLIPKLKSLSPTWEDLEEVLSQAPAPARLALPTEDWVAEYVLANARGTPTLAGVATRFTDTNTELTIARIRTLMKKDRLYAVPNQHQGYVDFLAGKAAATILSVSNYRSVLARAGFKLRLFMPPRLKRKDTILGGGDLIVPGGPGRKLDEKTRHDVATFLKWFYLGRGTVVWSNTVGYLPVSKTGQADPLYQSTLARRPQDRPVFMNADHWSVKTFYDLEELCNIIKLRQTVEKTFAEALINPNFQEVLRQADTFSKEVLAKQPCP